MNLDSLNPEQKRAATHTDGALMIVAGAGTGKTRVITHRIAHLIDTGVLPERILAVTFTNKAAHEMRERLSNLLGMSFGYPYARNAPMIGTFHSLAVRILRDNAKLLGMPKTFSILDRDDSLSIIKRVSKELTLDPKQFPPGALLAHMSKQKGEAVTLAAFRERANEYFSRIVASVWERYERECAREKAYDFDDLLLATLELLRRYPEVRARYHDMWSHLHVDEYQDTNTVQYEIVRLLSEKHGNICIVGDHDQCIYTWRSADMRNLDRFEKDFKDVTVVTLEENYRSTQTILAAANDAIRLNEIRKEKNLFTRGAAGEKIEIYTAANEGDEAAWVAERASELMHSGVPAHEIAVLFRAHFQSRALEEGFLKTGVPYQVLGVRFFERKEVRDVLSYVHAALNPDSATHLARAIATPARGIGKVTLLKMLAGLDAELPAKAREKVVAFRNLLSRIGEKARTSVPSETIKFVLRESGIERELSTEEDAERLLNVRELVSLATRYDTGDPEEGLHTFLEEAALASDQDALSESTDSVKLMTIHAAKGLEFQHVFITGLEEGLFPDGRSGEREKPEEREEERRLLYVALTRARLQLHLSHTLMRTIFGTLTVNVPSAFLSDIPEDLVVSANPEDEWGGGRELLTIDF